MQTSGNLKAEAMRSCLGQLAYSSFNLSTLMDCAGGEKDDRVTFVQEVQTPGCIGVTNAQHGNPLFVQVVLTASAHLASGGGSQ